MKQDLKTKLISRKIKKPNPFLMFIVMRILGILNRFYKVKFNYDYNPKSIKKGPTILLASHASRLEFIYMIYGFKHNDINIVCGYQNIIKKATSRTEMSSTCRFTCKAVSISAVVKSLWFSPI